MQILSAIIGGQKKRWLKRTRKRSIPRQQRERAVDPRQLPAYSIAEVARYLGIALPTLHSWVRPGHLHGDPIKPLIIIPSHRQKGHLSFLNLVEAHVLQAFNREYRFPRVPVARLRFALDCVRQDLDTTHPLAERKFRDHGLKLFVARFQGVHAASEVRQKEMRDLIRVYLDRIDYDVEGVAICLYPFTDSNDLEQPKNIAIKHNVSFARPSIRNTGVSTRVIAERHRGGESVEVLAQDYGFKTAQIEAAIGWESAAAE